LAIAMTLIGAPVRAAPPDRRFADSVLTWNDQTNRLIQATSTDPFQASRVLALESIAVFDTVRSISGAPGFLVCLPAASDLNADTAAAAAAHAMLGRLFPSKRGLLDAALADSLADQPAGPARDRAVAFGRMVAEAVFAVRDRDGWNAAADFRAGTAPGQWRPTPPDFQSSLDPQWATLVPFAMTKPNQFRPPGPPSPGSAAFKAATAEVALIGDAKSPVRTASQTEIAHYWSDAIGTYAPAGHWNAIAASLLAHQGPGARVEAELFAELNVGIADAGIAVADAKYTYSFWRPVTVIRAGGGGKAPVPNWSPLLRTPNHRSYISGHSGFSGAAATILTARFGTRPFSFASDSLPGVTRSFTNFQQAAEEAAKSREFGGIHYSFDNVDGLATGRAIGEWTLAAFRRIADDRGPVIVMDRVGKTPDLAGFALDNASHVTSVMVRLDGGEPFSAAVDDRGRFTIPRQRLGLGHPREVVVTTISAAGRTATAALEIGAAAGGQ